MKADQFVKRRDFLQIAGTTSLAGWLSGLAEMNGYGGQAGRRAIKPKSAEKLVAQLDAISGQYPTVPRKQAALLNLLVKATRARRLLEVGTAYGYTTIWLALALEETGGKLITIEIQPERVELAKQHVVAAGLSHRVTFKRGNAHEVLPTLDGPFDFVVLDADKDRQEDYFHKLFPEKLPPGGLFIAHNAILLADKMKSYLDLVQNHPEFDTVIVSATMEDGLALSYRRRTSA